MNNKYLLFVRRTKGYVEQFPSDLRGKAGTKNWTTNANIYHYHEVGPAELRSSNSLHFYTPLPK